MRVAVVGATGLIGRHLTARLAGRGDAVVAVSRTGAAVVGADAVRWDPADRFPAGGVGNVDAAVNLSGATLTAGRWSPAQKAAILESRVATTRAVAAWCTDGGPGVLVNASAVGVYGATDATVDESAPPGHDFLASVCVEWEGAALQAADAGVRVVVARSGIVLSNDGGALPRLVRLARLGVLGTLGSGAQWVPWIHHRDETAALAHCLDRPEVRGPVNLVAPCPVRQRALAAALRHAVHRPPTLRAPAALVRAAMGEASALVLTGQRAVPGVLERSGFAFELGSLDAALTELFAR